MSADGWTTCPRCKERAVKAKQMQADKARKGYGKLPPEEYERDILAARKPIDQTKFAELLREDYECGIRDDGRFVVNYFARCDKCGLKHTFKYSELVEI